MESFKGEIEIGKLNGNNTYRMAAFSWALAPWSQIASGTEDAWAASRRISNSRPSRSKALKSEVLS